MLLQIPVARLPHEWEAIAHDLRRALKFSRDWSETELLICGLKGSVQFWRVTNSSEGYVATQVTEKGKRRTFWVLFAGGVGGGISAMRDVMDELRQVAQRSGCADVRFKGRDWRRVFPEFTAMREIGGRWAFRKAVS